MKKIIFCLILLIFLGFRLLYYSADSFPVSWSSGGYTDIGFYTHNARHKVLFDQWSFGSWDNRFLFPAFNYYYYLFFKAGGVNITSVVLATIFIQLIALFFLYKILQQIYKNDALALVGILIYSYTFVVVRNNRIPFNVSKI